MDSNQAFNEIARKYPEMRNTLHSDDAKAEMEAVKYFLLLTPDRSSIFFANHVLLVEGPTEVALINKLIGDGKIKDGDCGLYVLDCIGKYNMPSFMNLLSNLGISHSVIYDDDDNKDKHKDINQLIEDSKTGLTLCTKTIMGDIEKLLGIPRSKSPHRKPQQALYSYEMGELDEAKLNEFCELVESCLPIETDK